MPFILYILSPGTNWSLVKAIEPGRKDAMLGQDDSASEFPKTEINYLSSKHKTFRLG